MKDLSDSTLSDSTLGLLNTYGRLQKDVMQCWAFLFLLVQHLLVYAMELKSFFGGKDDHLTMVQELICTLIHWKYSAESIGDPVLVRKRTVVLYSCSENPKFGMPEAENVVQLSFR
jgi:hypothetical protein